MNETPPASSEGLNQRPAGRLGSWKEIAAYVKRDVSTVQRWEKREGMPVHRHVHDKLGSVYAFRSELDRWWQTRSPRLEAEEGEFGSAIDRTLHHAARPRVRKLALLGVGVTVVVAGALLGFVLGKRSALPLVSTHVARVHQLTDMVGIEEFPAISPDGKSVAYAASVDGRRQIFVRLIAGGSSLRITSDPVDHQHPRWLPDSSSLVYFSPAAPGHTQGTVWEVPALGGVSRRLIDSISGADVSADGQLAFFRLANGQVELVTTPSDASNSRQVAQFPARRYYQYPRWSPDLQWIAFLQGDRVRSDVYVVPSRGGESRRLSHDHRWIAGLAWLPDSTGVLFGSSGASTLPYLPAFSLWEARLDRKQARQITSTESSYEQPDIGRTGMIAVSRMRRRSNIWKVPLDGSPAENASRAQQITQQTAQVHTPTAAPDNKAIAFLSDSGGHANLWVMNTESGELQQITHERDPGIAVGVPIWSPDGQAIAFVYSRGNPGFAFGVWLVSPDGGDLRAVATRGLGPAWSTDGRWLYYADAGVLKKTDARGGPTVDVRSDQVRNVIGAHGATVYYLVERPLVDGTPEYEIRAATPEDGPSRVLARFPASRAADWQIVNPALSPDGNWLALPLTNIDTTNLWTLSTSSGEWRQVTDFGGRATFIARRVSWSADGRFILAAVGEGDADIVLLDHLLTPSSGS